MAVKRSTVFLFLLLALSGRVAAQQPSVSMGAQGVTINVIDTDVRAAVQTLSRFLDRPVVFGAIGANHVTLQTNRPVPIPEVKGLLSSMLESVGHELVEEPNVYRVQQKGSAPRSGFPAQLQPQQAAPYPGAQPGGVQLFVIRLHHARAADVAATVNALYGRASALGELGGRPSTLSGELRDNRIPPYSDQSASAAPGAVGRAGGFAGEVTIVPDARTNSLLVRASATDFELVRTAVEQVDVRPLQVFIEVMIAEVRRNSDFSYALSAAVGGQRVRGSDNTTVGGSTSGTARSDLEVNVLGIGGVDLSLRLRAGVAQGSVTILSRPVVFAANNERAEILVGDQRPFVQLRRTTDGGSVDQVVQYKDVGTRLSVLPTISGDGYVQLQVTQEVNTATGATGAQDAPVISTRTVETALLVRDGQTAVLGGLSEVLRERGSSGVPLLSSIPIIGGAFGSRTRRSDDTELFIFLTPRVVRDDAELDSAVTDLRTNSPRSGKLSRKPSLVQPRPKPAPAPVPQPAP